jgi:hypothetical protein
MPGWKGSKAFKGGSAGASGQFGIPMKRIIFLALMLSFARKSRRQNCTVFATDILRDYPKKVYIIHGDKNRILGVEDYGRDKTKAGAYYFFPDGKLQYYRFFETDSAYDYEEEYNEEGELINKVDNPLVDIRIREVNNDSAIVGYFLFSMNKNYRNAKVKTTNGLVIYPNLTDDTSYSNMKSFFISLNTRNLSRFKIIFSCNYENPCTLEMQSLADTLPLIKNPRLNRDNGQ